MAHFAEIAAAVMAAGGILAVLIGAAASGGLALRELRRADGSTAFRTFRQGVGRSILLGLEFLVGADILRTVTRIPDLQTLAVLAGIVAIRTVLSFTLEVELGGSWPWQRRARQAPEA